MQRSPVLIIDYVLSSYKSSSLGPYDVYISFIHQIPSQCPSLFSSVQKLIAEMGPKHNLALLFQHFGLTATDAIVSDIDSSPGTETLLYKREIKALQRKDPKILRWASSALSWMMWSVRPLRIEELGAAVAINFTGCEMRSLLSIDMERDLEKNLGCLVVIGNRHARIASALARKILEEDVKVKRRGLENDYSLTRPCLHYISSILNQGYGTWERCLSQVSWRHQTPVPVDPSLAFLNLACRFWPTHLSHVRLYDNRLKRTVAKSLSALGVGDRWFQLYLLSISQCTNELIVYQKVRGPTTAIKGPRKNTLGKGSLTWDITDTRSPCATANSERLAARICSYIGLVSILSEILGRPISERRAETMYIRRGYVNRVVTFVGTRSQHYPHCAMPSNDDRLIKRLLDLAPAQAIEWFLLHKAAQAACLETARTLFNLLDNSARIDQERRTPLHLAALGGSADIIRLLRVMILMRVLQQERLFPR